MFKWGEANVWHEMVGKIAASDDKWTPAITFASTVRRLSAQNPGAFDYSDCYSPALHLAMRSFLAAHTFLEKEGELERGGDMDENRPRAVRDAVETITDFTMAAAWCIRAHPPSTTMADFDGEIRDLIEWWHHKLGLDLDLELDLGEEGEGN